MDFHKWNPDITKSEARAILKISFNTFVFFSSSRLVPEKQIDLMLIELSKVKTQEFLIFLSGNGPSEHEIYLHNLVKKLNIDNRVSFIGFVPEDQLKLHYAAADAFISTSKSEAGPMSTALAALYELPIITTNTGFVFEFLKKNNGGIYIDKNNSEQWHQAFMRALDGNEIPICPKEAVVNFFDWKTISSYYITTYREVLRDFYNKKQDQN
jgi:glycosyltransferase involved in cell wall biosynthesis